MSETSKKIGNDIRNGKINFNVKPPQSKKRGILKKILLWPVDMTLAMFGLSIEELKNGSNNHNKHTGYSGGYTTPSNAGSAWRDSQKVGESPFSSYGFNPIEAENLALYLKGIDGKGDPEHCDCDHDHDR